MVLFYPLSTWNFPTLRLFNNRKKEEEVGDHRVIPKSALSLMRTNNQPKKHRKGFFLDE
jgi:hypothetical protein